MKVSLPTNGELFIELPDGSQLSLSHDVIERLLSIRHDSPAMSPFSLNLFCTAPPPDLEQLAAPAA